MGNKKSPYNEDQMSIAPGAPRYKIADWKKLDLDTVNSQDWCKAIKILEARIRGRYLDPVDKLIEYEEPIEPENRRFGFTILAIDCLLIETLQAFIDGEKNTYQKTKRMFVKFLTERPSFSKHFKEKKLACRFYKDFRNGILHQAETRCGGLIWSVGPLLCNTGTGMIINRTKFHEALKAEFDSYLTDLKDTKQGELRQKFRQQMDYVVEVSRHKGKCK